MSENDNRIYSQAFGEGSEGLATVALHSQLEAIDRLHTVLADPATVSLLHGPALSGKSTIIRQFVKSLIPEIAVAVVDGAELSARQLLAEIVIDFGYQAEMTSSDDLMRMAQVLAVQQTRTRQVPVVVIENIDRMRPDALDAVLRISELTFQGQYVVRLVLSGGEQAPRLLAPDGAAALGGRNIATIAVPSLSTREAQRYLHSRLLAAGVHQPASLLPPGSCEKLQELSGGSPGLLSRNAERVLRRAKSLPVSIHAVTEILGRPSAEREAPALIVTSNGEVVHRYVFRRGKERKITVGRSSLADLVIDDSYASKFHAMFLHFRDALVLVDLNSANGTFVNSVRVKGSVLKSDDIVSVSHHRIKVLNAPLAPADVHERIAAADTKSMQTIGDKRQQRQQNPLHLAHRSKD